MSKKNVITKIFELCVKNGDMSFDNDLVKKFCQEHKFGNPFDVTKIDNADKLPELLVKEDYGIVHLGNGHHQFVKGISSIYHKLEEIHENIEWKYKKSLLNQTNSSESNMLSVANNQRILHHFLFGKDTEFEDVDILKRPKTYFPHRTKTNFANPYNCASIELTKSAAYTLVRI